jgi:hypothetical protein
MLNRHDIEPAGQSMSASRTVLGVALMLGLLAAPDGAVGQTPGTVRRVGIIHQGGVYAVMVDGLRQGLRELGFEEDKHVVLDIRDTGGDLKAVTAAARDLERLKVDLIYTSPRPSRSRPNGQPRKLPSSSSLGAIRSRPGWWRASRSRAGG